VILSFIAWQKCFPFFGRFVDCQWFQYPAQKSLSKEEQRYFHAVFTHYHQQCHSIIAQRCSVFQIFTNAFAAMGLHSRFDLADGDVPGAFLFQAPNKDLVKLKSQLQNLGIECSVFYGEDTFYLPCHQRMNSSTWTT
jgi:hypothetical protein